MASIEIAPGWLDAVEAYVEGLMANSVATAQRATTLFRELVVESARQNEQWTSLADNISLWSQDGHLVIGVQDPQLASLATVLEYGDLDTPPNPLLRNLVSPARDASREMRHDMESIYGPDKFKVAIPKVEGMSYGD